MQIQRPFGRTLIMTAVILLLYLCVGEAVARTGRFQAKFARPTWGSRHPHFERQLDRLNHIVNQVGPVDCLFLGSSMVINDIDPLLFANAYRNESGQDIRCFNFGVDGLTALGAAALAEILVKDYQPRLLVYGTDARDYVVKPQADDAAVILDTPWIRYRLGEFSIEGWLYDNSSLLRYRRPLRNLLQLNFTRSFWNQDSPSEWSKYGFIPEERVSEFVKTPPDPESELVHVQYYYGLQSDYEMLPENLLALDEIASLADKNTEVLILEMPVPDTYFTFFGDDGRDYVTFLNNVEAVAGKHSLMFWNTTAENLIPETGWADYSHLNAEGAKIFSEWLGKNRPGSDRG